MSEETPYRLFAFIRLNFYADCLGDMHTNFGYHVVTAHTVASNRHKFSPNDGTVF